MTPTVLILACGALARELVELQRANQWRHVNIQCLPADLHYTPKEIPHEVRDALMRYRPEYEHIFVAYADCGTGGLLDPVLAEFGVERLPGAHCYEFFAGQKVFSRLAEEEPGTFYLTDFLVRHFDRLVIAILGLDEHPQLRDAYFGNYRRVIYLAQTDDPELEALAREQADYLGLEYQLLRTGLDPLNLLLKEPAATWQN